MNGSVTYSLTSILPRVEPPLLGLNSTTGQIYLLRNLPSDWTRRQIEATVIALDGGGLSSLVQVYIQLISIPYGPRFDQDYYWVSISEADSIGHLVGTIQLKQNNQKASLIYRIVNFKSFKEPLEKLIDNNEVGSLFDHWSPHVNEHDSMGGLEDCPFSLEFNTGENLYLSSSMICLEKFTFYGYKIK